MKRVIIAIMVLLLTGALCYAQGARNTPYTTHEGKSVFTNLSVMGMDTSGVPGYIELWNAKSPSDGDAYSTYYLWVDEGGTLCLASYTTISGYTSFPDGDWGATAFNPACTIVGTQTAADPKGTGK